MPVRRIVRGQVVESAKLRAARRMRHEPTPEEDTLWQCVRGGKLGAKFRRQQVIDGFIVDYYCHAAALVVELDGAGHATEAQAVYDAERDRHLTARGLRVLRIPNAAVRDDLGGVLAQIAAALER